MPILEQGPKGTACPSCGSHNISHNSWCTIHKFPAKWEPYLRMLATIVEGTEVRLPGINLSLVHAVNKALSRRVRK